MMNIALQVGMAAHPGLMEWLLLGETGISSKTIVSTIIGVRLDDYQSEPYDPGDFRRCEVLLRRVPTLRPLMDRMREKSSWWAYLVDNWDRIVETMEREVPGVFDAQRPRGSTPEAYALIRSGEPR